MTKYPPFMTDRSPSNERAQAESEHPGPVGDAQVLALLAQLWEAESNAIDAYQKAAETKADVGVDIAKHQAHRQELANQIAARGGSIPRPDETRQILNHGAASVEAAGTTLPSVLQKLEAELAAVYTKALASQYLDDKLRTALTNLT